MHLSPIDTCKPETKWVLKKRRLKVNAKIASLPPEACRTEECCMSGCHLFLGVLHHLEVLWEPCPGVMASSHQPLPAPGILQQILMELWQPLSCSCRCIWCHAEAQNNVPQSCSATVTMDAWARTPCSALRAAVGGKSVKPLLLLHPVQHQHLFLSSTRTEKNTQLTACQSYCVMIPEITSFPTPPCLEWVYFCEVSSTYGLTCAMEHLFKEILF